MTMISNSPGPQDSRIMGMGGGGQPTPGGFNTGAWFNNPAQTPPTGGSWGFGPNGAGQNGWGFGPNGAGQNGTGQNGINQNIWGAGPNGNNNGSNNPIDPNVWGSGNNGNGANQVRIPGMDALAEVYGELATIADRDGAGISGADLDKAFQDLGIRPDTRITNGMFMQMLGRLGFTDPAQQEQILRGAWQALGQQPTGQTLFDMFGRFAGGDGSLNFSDYKNLINEIARLA